MKTASALLLLMLLPVTASHADVAADKSPRQIVLVPHAQFSNEQQEKIIRTLAASRQEIVTFVAAFPKGSFSVWRPDPQSQRIRVDLDVRIRNDYLVNLWYDALFDPNFTKVQDSHCESFGVVVMADVDSLRPGKALCPIELTTDDLKAFCADPDAFIAARRRLGQKG